MSNLIETTQVQFPSSYSTTIMDSINELGYSFGPDFHPCGGSIVDCINNLTSVITGDMLPPTGGTIAEAWDRFVMVLSGGRPAPSGPDAIPDPPGKI